MNPQSYSFLTRETFDRIFEAYTNQRKNKRSLMDRARYNECLNILKNPDIQCNPTLKHWAINTFKVLHVGTIEELHIRKQGRNNLGTQVCVVENSYEII